MFTGDSGLSTLGKSELLLETAAYFEHWFE
jgi:hypothetical protein